MQDADWSQAVDIVPEVSGTAVASVASLPRQVIQRLNRKQSSPANMVRPAKTRVIQKGCDPSVETSQGCREAQ